LITFQITTVLKMSKHLGPHSDDEGKDEVKDEFAVYKEDVSIPPLPSHDSLTG
jgi:hypothetical protein